MKSLRHQNLFSKAARIAAVLALLAGASVAVPPAAPTNLVGVSDNSTGTVDFTWEDNSDDEAGFILEIFLNGSWQNFFGTIPADEEFFSVNGPFATAPEEPWRVSAINAGDETSAPSNEVGALTFNVPITVSETYHKCQIGDPVSFTMAVGGPGTPEIVSAGPLPAGVTFDPATDTISGTPTEGGFFPITIIGRDGINQRKATIALAVVDPPVVVLTPPFEGVEGSLQVFELLEIFDDPDTETTAVLRTNLGDVPLTLFDAAAPLHSANFRGYMNRGDWDGSIIHRSINNFVLQGGWLTPDPVEEGTFTTTTSAGFVPDEYDDSRPNVESTFAMAKNNPGEATTNWFISLKDNAQNLDFQAGGFASFARVVGDGMTVLRAIEALQTGTYQISIDGGIPRDITDLPLTEVTGASPLNSQLVVINSVEEIDPMTYEIVSNSNPDSVTATVNFTGLVLEFMGAGGQSQITIAAIDLDGARTEATFVTTTLGRYANWAAATGAGAAGENDDGGVLQNSQEYAFGGDPASALDDTDRAPVFGEIVQGEDTFDTITFYHRKFAADVDYTAQSSIDLSTWTDQWTTADGTDAAQVVAVEEESDFQKITVRAPAPQSAATPRFFFRVKVVIALP